MRSGRVGRIFILALESKNANRVREIRRVRAVGELKEREKIRPSFADYSEGGKRRKCFIISDSKQYGEVWKGAVDAQITDNKMD